MAGCTGADLAGNFAEGAAFFVTITGFAGFAEAFGAALASFFVEDLPLSGTGAGFFVKDPALVVATALTGFLASVFALVGFVGIEKIKVQGIEDFALREYVLFPERCETSS